MKRLIILLLSVMMLLTGCTSTKNISRTVQFYYIHNEIEFGSKSGVIASNTVQIKYKNEDNLQILNRYFNGPTNYECISPFPAGITLIDFETTQDTARLTLSPHMSMLSGIDFTVACACLTRTVIELTGVQTVHLSIQDNLIDGQESIRLTMSSFTYWDDTDLNQSGR